MLLKSYKRGVICKIFKDNIDSWKKHKLSSFAEAKGGYTFDSKTYTNNGAYMVLTIGNVTGTRYTDIADIKRVSEMPNDLQAYQILNIGDIVISMTGNVGRVSIVSSDNCLLNQRVAKLNFFDSSYKEIIYQILSCDNFVSTMEQKGQGAAQKNIKNCDIESYEFFLPNNMEQIEALSNVFKLLDTIIEKEITKLADLYQIKSALLQQLFI